MDNEQARFFDSRAAYQMFTTATNEKATVAVRLSGELSAISPGPNALRIFDAGLGDASVLAQLMRSMHKRFTHIPWLVVGKEISVGHLRQALAEMPDRLFEHPEMVFVITNLHYEDAPTLTTTADKPSANWRQVALRGTTSHEFSRQIEDLFSDLVEDWAVRVSPLTGNPLYVRPSVLVVYRKDREFLLESVIPQPNGIESEYDLIVASQSYRSRTPTESKVRSVIAPLARALARGGRLIGVHSHGNDPGLEIIREIWPDEDPFPSSRHDILNEAKAQLSQSDLVFHEHDDSEALFRFELHAMPSGDTKHIGTSFVLATWNAAVYVAQMDEPRIVDAMSSGDYLRATQAIIRKHGSIWFNDESFVISRNVEEG